MQLSYMTTNVGKSIAQDNKVKPGKLVVHTRWSSRLLPARLITLLYLRITYRLCPVHHSGLPEH